MRDDDVFGHIGTVNILIFNSCDAAWTDSVRQGKGHERACLACGRYEGETVAVVLKGLLDGSAWRGDIVVGIEHGSIVVGIDVAL